MRPGKKGVAKGIKTKGNNYLTRTQTVKSMKSRCKNEESKVSMLALTCEPSTWKVRSGQPIQGQPGNIIRHYLKKLTH